MGEAPRESSSSHGHGARSHQRKRNARKAKVKAGMTMRKSPGQLKSEIRGAQRLLDHKGDAMDAPSKLALERKLAALKYQLERTEAVARDASIVKKFDSMYRAVKFVERVKAVRKVKQAMRALSEVTGKEVGMGWVREKDSPAGSAAGEASLEGEEDQPDSRPCASSVAGLRAQLQEAQIDLCYVMHFPPGTKYIALYSDRPHAAKALAAQAEIRSQIRTLIESGALDVQLTVERCLKGVDAMQGDEPSKKRTKRKGPTRQEMERKALGNLLRGVGSAKFPDGVGNKRGSRPSRENGSDAGTNSESEAALNVSDEFFLADG